MDSGAALQDEERQRVFYDRIREWIVSMLMVVLLYLVSYWIVARYKKSRHREECYSGDEDALVYRISTWLCSFALCVSVGSVLLLPLSILTNEVLLLQPHSHYLRWINTSLIRGLWNQVFLGCNLSLFLLLPFAYFFVESEGMAGWRKGLVSRVCETVILLGLLAAMALVLTWLFSALLLSLLADYEVSSRWLSPLPLLYTLVSMLGVLLMALCTPVGISRLFSLLGHLITKPKLRGVVQDELVSVRMEEAALQRRLKLGCGGQQSLADLLEKVKEKRLELGECVNTLTYTGKHTTQRGTCGPPSGSGAWPTPWPSCSCWPPPAWRCSWWHATCSPCAWGWGRTPPPWRPWDRPACRTWGPWGPSCKSPSSYTWCVLAWLGSTPPLPSPTSSPHLGTPP